METVYAVMCSLILMLPLIVQLYMLITDPTKLFTIFHYYASDEQAAKDLSPKLLEHYSRNRSSFDSKSDSEMLATTLKSVSSTPAALSRIWSTTSAKKKGSSFAAETKHSFAFVETDAALPLVGIGCTYSWYRHKAFEECLLDHYGPRYPPGEVVLNSMQLHLLDSRSSLGPGTTGLFDFVKESEPALNGPEVSRNLEIEYLNPLDHFVTRQLRRPLTEERATETPGDRHELDRRASSDNAAPDPIKAVITAREKNARINRRSGKKIETARKRDLSSLRRV
ncbi:uncharacterized protein LOC117225391 [Megalopta genalis]|uniref:uncharacterized protein LOC117225391 n=1 Tax=Megalopta genalis TaxID=115081 RepID=UPI003FCFCF82